ncbi:hypothetical protein [Lentzea indica]|uniref:hypothetical protein n=1 Tax=Lentzea indica TaxID=2604800 RepID=UPI001FE30942|nr:hypothetical protein [Lentzea indica]
MQQPLGAAHHAGAGADVAERCPVDALLRGGVGHQRVQHGGVQQRHRVHEQFERGAVAPAGLGFQVEGLNGGDAVPQRWVGVVRAAVGV